MTYASVDFFSFIFLWWWPLNTGCQAAVKYFSTCGHATHMQFAFFFLTFSYPDLRNHESQFYSQEQVKSLVSYAADRGIRVIPEVESA